MTLWEVPDLDPIVATLQDVSPAPSQGHTIPKGSSSACPTPCLGPPGQGFPCRPPQFPPCTPLPQPSSSAGIITLLQQSQAAFWAPSAKPVEGCDPQFSPTWALRFVSGGPGTPFLGSSPVPWPSPPSWRGGTLRQRGGQRWEPLARSGAALWVLWPCWQQQAVAWSKSLRSPQRVPPSSSAEAMTLSIQAAYGAMRV